MNLLICHSGDRQALRLYARLMQYHADIALVNADALSCALQWNYLISREATRLDILLANKRLTKEKTGVVINRIGTVNPVGWQRSDSTDIQYVTQEMYAFFLSWLYSLSRETLLLNPPGANGLSGHYYSQPQWMSLAHEAGLPVGDYAEDTHSSEDGILFSSGNSTARMTHLLVVQNEIFGPPVPGGIATGCKKLARLSGNNMLEIILEKQNRWQFKRASPFPHFSLYGLPFLYHILKLLS